MIEPDHVYVIPPGKSLALEEGRLRLGEAAATHRMPIDFFLRSLAEERGPAAVAVILSGTGTDGTLGAAAVKAADGLVAVQKPDSAAYPGMPSSALENVRADFELAPDELPAAIIGYLRRRVDHGPAESHSPRVRSAAETLSHILGELRRRTGHDFSEYKTSTVMRRLDRRMAVVGADNPGEYAGLLERQPEEIDRLFAEMLIPVTGFFRDAQAFSRLQEQAIAGLLEGRDPGEELRIWVPGCSTGEEVYSIAMLLRESMDALKRRPPLQIFATDIDRHALEVARRGRYPASIALDVSASRLQRFFTRDADHYVVGQPLRESLVFAEQDVARDPPFSRMDLISCRNLLIYMNTALQQRLLPVFHYALRPGGYLFLGAAETIGKMDDLFEPVDASSKLFRRRNDEVARRRSYALPQFERQRERGGAAVTDAAPQQATDRAAAVQRLLLRDHVPAAILLDAGDRVLYLHGGAGRYLEPAAGQPSTELLPMLRAGLAEAVRRAVQRARGSPGAAARGTAEVELEGRTRRLRVEARSVDEPGLPRRCVLLLLTEDAVEPDEPRSDEQPGAREAGDLQRELDETREALQATIEELETSNEELQSSNEELQSTNEELETSRKELQSVNEELRSVNAELENKVEEASRAKDDMFALLSSTEIGVVSVDADLRIERFTPAVTHIIPVREIDVGRPISELSSWLQHETLKADLRQVVEQLESRREQVEGEDGHSYMMRMRPYRSRDGRVLGAVLVFVDVTDELERAFLHKLRDALGQSEELVALVDLDGGIEYVNAAFCDATGYGAEELVGQVPDALAWPNLSDEDRRAMDQALRRGRIWRGGFRFARRDGGTVATDALFAPIRTSAGITHAVAFLHVESREE